LSFAHYLWQYKLYKKPSNECWVINEEDNSDGKKLENFIKVYLTIGTYYFFGSKNMLEYLWKIAIVASTDLSIFNKISSRFLLRLFWVMGR
jgi:hypothetical protein